MKKSLIITILSFWAIGSAFAQGGGYVDDLYRGSTKKSKAAEANQPAPKVSSSAQKQSQQMPANWSPNRQSAAPATPTLNAPKQELVTSYDDALQRRLDAYKNYREMDDDYWKLMENYHKMLSNRYDPELYNVITFGNEMWAEPVYITALFDGSDPAAGVRGKEFASQSQNRNNVTINVRLDVGPSWWWNDPWDYWYSPWRNPWRYGYYGGWRPYWGWNSYWGWNGGWGPSWGWGPGWGPSWGWGPGWGPGYYPPHWGGGHGGHYGRPVIWDDNRPGWGTGPGYRPGSGSSGGRPNYSGGYRRNENGTGVSINNGSGAGNRRPGGSGGAGVSIRPGGSSNQYNPGASTRPSVGPAGTGNTYNPSPERTYRRDMEVTPAPRRETQSQSTRSEPSYSSPSRGSSSGGGSYGGGGGSSSGGGGGYRRR